MVRFQTVTEALKDQITASLYGLRYQILLDTGSSSRGRSVHSELLIFTPRGSGVGLGSVENTNDLVYCFLWINNENVKNLVLT